MTTIYLHIGMPKTGTTSIQKFLSNNQEKLLEKGYLYPMSTRILTAQNITSNNHHGLSRELAKIYDPKHPWGNQRLNSKDREGGWENLKIEINTLKPKSVIISSESFTVRHIFYNLDIIDMLKRMLEGYKTKIVIYIRRQDEFFRSWYSQNVKSSTYRFNVCKQMVNDFDLKKNNMTDIMKFVLQSKDYGDYYSILEPWKKIFGIENIIVRPFEKKQIKNANIVDDFLEVIDLNHNSSDIYFSNSMIEENISLSGKTIKLINLLDEISQMKRLKKSYQGLCWDEQYLFFHRFMKRYTNSTIKLASLISRFIPEFLVREELLSKSDRVSIMNYFEESNRKVAQEYLGRENGRLFFS